MPVETLWLVSPVYFDVESYTRLRKNVRSALSDEADLDLRFVAVDDSAGADPEMRRLESLPDQILLTPPFPLGHQRTLVFGLRRLSTMIKETDIIVTLDADGEDKPEDLARLLAPLREPEASVRTIVVAARTKRRESPAFKVLYLLFKNIFRMVTGTIIRSGNYAAYRGWLTHNVLFHPHFDLCYSSSLLSLGLNVRRVSCERGSRYAGVSKMGYVKLIQHGFRMLMPFADRIATRGLIALSLLLGLGVLGVGALVSLRLAGLASPGWLFYFLCATILLCVLGGVCMVIVFALVVQSQSLSLAQLDMGLRDAGPKSSPVDSTGHLD